MRNASLVTCFILLSVFRLRFCEEKVSQDMLFSRFSYFFIGNQTGYTEFCNELPWKPNTDIVGL